MNVHRIRRILVATAAIAVLAGATTTASAIERIVMGLTASPTIFHPWDLAQHNSPNHAQFYNRLVRLDKQLNPVPELAHGWEFVNDGKSLLLHLVEGARFHNGRDLTATDVKRSHERILGKFTDSSANLAPLARLVEEIVVVDERTVRIDYEKPNPAVFDFLDLFYIVDMDNFDKVRTEPVGSGPYRLAEFIPQDRMVLVPNEDYWREPPTVELEYRVIPDPQAMVLNLQSDTVDAALIVPGREVEPLRQRGYEVFAANPDGIVLDLLFNTEWGPVADKRVRQGINMLINRNRVHRVIYQGRGETRCLPFPSYSIAYDGEREARCEFNVEKAKALFAEAGYPDGFELVITTSRQQSEEWLKFAELLQSDLQRAGLKATVKDLDVAGKIASFWSRKYQIEVHNYGRGNKDPASLFGTAVVWKPYEGENVSNYYNPKLEQLTIDAASTLDEEERRRIYGEVSDILLEDVYIVPVHTNPRYFAHNKTVSGVTATVDGHMMFEWAKKQ